MDGFFDLFMVVVDEGLLDECVMVSVDIIFGEGINLVIDWFIDGVIYIWILYDDVEVCCDLLMCMLWEVLCKFYFDVLYFILFKLVWYNYLEFIDE